MIASVTWARTISEANIVALPVFASRPAGYRDDTVTDERESADPRRSGAFAFVAPDVAFCPA